MSFYYIFICVGRNTPSETFLPYGNINVGQLVLSGWKVGHVGSINDFRVSGSGKIFQVKTSHHRRATNRLDRLPILRTVSWCFFTLNSLDSFLGAPKSSCRFNFPLVLFLVKSINENNIDLMHCDQYPRKISPLQIPELHTLLADFAWFKPRYVVEFLQWAYVSA